MGRTVTRKEISYRSGISLSSIDTYMGHWRFNKYLKGSQFKLTKAFLQELIDYLFSRSRVNYKAINKISRWLDEITSEEIV